VSEPSLVFDEVVQAAGPRAGRCDRLAGLPVASVEFGLRRADLARTAAEREFLHAVPLPDIATTQIHLAAPADYAELAARALPVVRDQHAHFRDRGGVVGAGRAGRRSGACRNVSSGSAVTLISTTATTCGSGRPAAALLIIGRMWSAITSGPAHTVTVPSASSPAICHIAGPSAESSTGGGVVTGMSSRLDVESVSPRKSTCSPRSSGCNAVRYSRIWRAGRL